MQGWIIELIVLLRESSQQPTPKVCHLNTELDATAVTRLMHSSCKYGIYRNDKSIVIHSKENNKSGVRIEGHYLQKPDSQ